jgi:predicted Zn-dependent protease
MIQSRLGGNISPRASKFILLLLTILVLLQSVSVAQNNAVRETDARSGTISAALAPGMTKALNTYHERSIPEISAAGNGNVGCTRGLANRYSPEAQVEMGRSYAKQVEATSKLITDPVITEYVNRISQNLARNSGAQVPFTIKIIDTDDVNAFSLPGGFLFVDSGLILAVDNEAELAGVISHEIAHVAACHAAEEIAHEELTNPASMPLIFRLLLRPITRNTIYLKPTRSFESEADFFGVEYLYKAGYDPRALSSFLEKVKARERQKPGSPAKPSEFQPQMTDRIERIRLEINTLLPSAPEYKLDTSEFQEIKERLAELENRHKVAKNYGAMILP